jgi:hypothetical protein
VNVTFACPGCERPARLDLPAASWQCPACDHRFELRPAAGPLTQCAVCGNEELYKKKDFPHWLGLTILAVACLGFVVCNAFYLQWWGWGILIGSALFDGLLYLRVGDAIVCYRCNAHYHGFAVAEQQPFELVVAERYRQERLRREELKK